MSKKLPVIMDEFEDLSIEAYLDICKVRPVNGKSSKWAQGTYLGTPKDVYPSFEEMYNRAQSTREE